MNNISKQLLICVLVTLSWVVCGQTLAEGKGPREQLPDALALLDGTPAMGAWVGLTLTLVGTPEKQLQGFGWRQKSGPKPGFVLTSSDSARVWLLLSTAGKYSFQLFARGRKGAGKGIVTMPLEFEVPKGKSVLETKEALAKAGAGEKILLPGEGWLQVYGPPVKLKLDTKTWKSSFRPFKAGFYLFEAIRAGDTPHRRAIQVPAGKDKLIGNRRPLAVLHGVAEAVTGKEITMDATLSSDPDGPKVPLKTQWSGDLGTRGLNLISQKGLRATFMASRKGVYRVQLVVSDSSLESKPAVVFLRVKEGSEADQENVSKELGLIPNRSDPLHTNVTMMLYESNLDRAIQIFPSRSKWTLRVDLEAGRPETFQEVPLHLGVKAGSVRLVLDWMGRQARLNYRFHSEKSLMLTKPGVWWKHEKLKSAVFAIDALYKRKDGEDILQLFRKVFRGVIAYRSDTSLSLAVSDKAQTVMALMPERALNRLKEMLVHLRAPEGFGIPAPPVPTKRALWIRKKLYTVRVSAEWKARRLDLLLARDLVTKSGFSVGFDPTQFPKGYPFVNLTLKNVPLRQAIREIVEVGKFSGCQVHEDGGLWFYKGYEPYPSSEVLWDIAYVRTYKIDQLLKKVSLLSGEVIAHQIKRRIYSDSWRDSAASCIYHKPTGKLVVIHGPAAHKRVLEFLNDLSVRGIDAMGPALE